MDLKAMFKNKKVLAVVAVPLLILILGGGYYLWSINRFDPEEFDRVMSEAQDSYDDMKYSQALELYLEASELAPRQYEPYSNIVKILSDKSRFDDAKNVVKGVIVHLDTELYAQLWSDLGERYATAGEYFSAFECYEQSYKYSKDQGTLISMLDVAIRADRMDKVDMYVSQADSESETLLQILKEVEELQDSDTDLLDVVTAAKDYISNGYYSLAVELLTAHKDSMENYWEGKFYLGRALYEQGEYEDAIVYFDSAVSLGSDDPTLYLYFARAFNKLSEKNSSYNYYDRAVSFVEEDLQKDFVEEYFSLLLGDEQYNRAEELLSDHHDYIWSQLMFMELYSAIDDYDEFNAVLEELPMEEVPADQKERYLQIVSEYYLYEDVDLVTASEYIGMIDDSSWSYLYNGMLKAEEGSGDESLELFNSAIDSDLEGEVTEIAEMKIANL